MTNIIILHGTDGMPQSNWFMWLKGKLIGQGHHVWLPQLPGADAPALKAYTPFLLANKDFTFDSDTVLIGHSSGAVEILHLLQHLPVETKIKGALLVSAFTDDLGWDNLGGLFTEPFDFEIIKAHCTKFILLQSDNDPYVPLKQAEFLAKSTGGELILFKEQGHFSVETDPKYDQFPELLQFIDELIVA